MRLFSTSLIFVFFTLSLKAQLVGGKFRPGYYFDPDGVKHEGFINQKPSSFSRSAKSANAILFKSGKTGKRELIYATDMQSYVVEADSFAVVTLPSSLNNVRYRIDFARVLFDEKTKVFLIEEKASPSFGLSAGNRGAMPSINLSNYRSRTFLFGNDTDHLELMDKRNYKYVLASVFAASPELADRVSRLSYDEIEKFSEDYIAGKKAQKQSALKE